MAFKCQNYKLYKKKMKLKSVFLQDLQIVELNGFKHSSFLFFEQRCQWITVKTWKIFLRGKQHFIVSFLSAKTLHYLTDLGCF